MSYNGKFSLSKLQERDPLFADAVRNGLKWKVVKASVRKRYPRALNLIMTARNLNGQVQRKINAEQGLGKMHSLATEYQKVGRTPDWFFIKRAVTRGKPEFTEYVDALICFLATRAGGTEGLFLKEYLGFHSTNVAASERMLLGNMYAAAADFPYHCLALALLKVAFTCPKTKVVGGRCNWLNKGDFTRLAKPTEEATRYKCEKAEEVLSLARSLLHKAGIEEASSPTGWQVNSEGSVLIFKDSNLLEIFTKLDINMGRWAADRQELSKHKFDSPQQIASVFIQSLKEKFPMVKVSVYPETWQNIQEPSKHKFESPEQIAEAPSCGGIQLYSVGAGGESNDPMAAVRRKGFDLGACVGAPGDETAYTLEGVGWEGKSAHVNLKVVSKTGASLEASLPQTDASLPQTGCKKVSLDVFLETWKGVNKNEIAQNHTGWPEHRTVSGTSWKGLILKGRMIMALGVVGELVESTFQPGRKVNIVVKPRRKVESLADFGVGEIVLSPDTTSIRILESKAASSHDVTMVTLNTVPEELAKTHVLAPQTLEKNVSALWFVEATDDASQVNMEWGAYLVTGHLGADYVGEGNMKPVVVRKEASVPHGARSKAGMPTKPPAVTTPPEDRVFDCTFKVPVLVNSKKVAKGDELRFFRAKVEKRPRAPEPITISKLSRGLGKFAP